MPNPATPNTERSDIMHLRDSPDLVQPLGHYSHVAIHGGLVYVSGQLPVDQHGTALSDQAFDVQARQVLHNLDQCLITAGTDRSRLVMVTVYVTDIDQWPAFDAIYADWIGRHRPARAVAGASRLHYGAAVEVQAIAALS
ncbi:RidA family protein [Streptosporangium minutum]|uniref:RidA family protein n=1 Tax=Streptosporangium minutum TaxID=569862 RepID=A0A243RUA4_9ACTN|nr:RidA family protein [Streptosporangium minutum]OUC98753.1 RidA family protein [Streptosporangium minutum]